MTSLSGKEKATTRNMKITKGKISLVKQTYTEDSVDQPLRKIGGS